MYTEKIQIDIEVMHLDMSYSEYQLYVRWEFIQATSP